MFQTIGTSRGSQILRKFFRHMNFEKSDEFGDFFSGEQKWAGPAEAKVEKQKQLRRAGMGVPFRPTFWGSSIRAADRFDMAYPLRSSYAAPWTAAPAAPTAPLWGAPVTGGLAWPWRCSHISDFLPPVGCLLPLRKRFWTDPDACGSAHRIAFWNTNGILQMHHINPVHDATLGRYNWFRLSFC